MPISPTTTIPDSRTTQAVPIGTTPPLDARTAQATIRTTMWGAVIALVVLLIAGIALAYNAAVHIPDHRTMFSAGLLCIALAGQMMIAVGGLRAHLTLLRHQATVADLGELDAESLLTQLHQIRAEFAAFRAQVGADLGQLNYHATMGRQDLEFSRQEALSKVMLLAEAIAALERTVSEGGARLAEQYWELQQDQQRQAEVVANIVKDQLAARRQARGT